MKTPKRWWFLQIESVFFTVFLFCATVCDDCTRNTVVLIRWKTDVSYFPHHNFFLSFFQKRVNQTSESNLQHAPAMPPLCETYMESPELGIPDVKCLFSRVTVIQDQLNDQMGWVLMTSTCGFSSLFLDVSWQIREFSAPDTTAVTSEHKLRCLTLECSGVGTLLTSH